MKYRVYEYIIKESDDSTIVGSFTLKENAKHPEVVEELDARLVDEFVA